MLELFTFILETRKLLVWRVTEKRKKSSVGKKQRAKEGGGGQPVSLLPVWRAGRGGWAQHCCCHAIGTNDQHALKLKWQKVCRILQLLLVGELGLESWSGPITEILKWSRSALLQSVKSFGRGDLCIFRNGIASCCLLLCFCVTVASETMWCALAFQSYKLLDSLII